MLLLFNKVGMLHVPSVKQASDGIQKGTFSFSKPAIWNSISYQPQIPPLNLAGPNFVRLKKKFKFDLPPGIGPC